MMTTGKGTHYCVHCGFDMKAREQRECPACDGDLCESRKRVAAVVRPAKAKKGGPPQGDLGRAMEIVEAVAKARGTLSVNDLIAAFEDVRAEEREACAKLCDAAGAITPALHIRQRRAIGAFGGARG